MKKIELPETWEACNAKSEELSIEIAKIKQKLADSEATKDSTGREYTNPDWISRASFALRMKIIERQSIQNRMGVLRRASKGARQASFERVFMDCARDLLPTETWQLIIAQVYARHPELS